MCILFIAVGQHPRHPLIIAANRDEYHARPSEAMHRWRDAPGILAGRDGVAGGAWFGVNDDGRVAAVTNHRGAVADTVADGAVTVAVAAGTVANAADTVADGTVTDTVTVANATATVAKQSRGELVARFLRGDDSVDDYRAFLHHHHRDFNPFNLVYGDAGDLHCFGSDGAISRRLGDGFHAISNGALDNPWPKMSRGVALMKKQIATRGDTNRDRLAQVMRDRATAADCELPRTHLDRAREKHRSSIFIVGDDYGTRTTTLLFAGGGGFELYEFNYDADGGERDRRHCSAAQKTNA